MPPKDNLYQARLIKRRRRTKAQVEQLDRQIIEALESDYPQSVRHIFYCMTNPRLPEPVEKSDNGYNQIQSRCLKLRREERLPYGWFSDMGRAGYFVNTFSDASDFIISMQGLYRADIWRHADVRCEVWVESKSIGGAILNDCRELAVPLYPCGGFTSCTFAADAAQVHNSSGDSRPLHIIYFGDYDKAGVLIDKTLERELRTHLAKHIELRFDRVGINPDQIETFDLPTNPAKKSDRRSPEIDIAVEAEALPVNILRQIIRESVEALLPSNALDVAKVAEASERQHLLRMAELATAVE